MSAIVFSLRDASASVSGVEHGMANSMASKATLAVLDWMLGEESQRRRFLETYVRDCSRSFSGWREGGQRTVETFIAVADYQIRVGESLIHAGPFRLNTLLRLGGDTAKMLTRLHGQSSLHAWIAEEDRSWFAGIIERGRRDNFLRPEVGWEEVCEMLRGLSPGPCVTSYSVDDAFPNHSLAARAGLVGGYEKYEKLSRSGRWDWAIAALQTQCSPLLRMQPADWEAYKFDNGISAFDVIADEFNRRVGDTRKPR